MYSDMHVVSSGPGIQEKLGIRYNDSDIINGKNIGAVYVGKNNEENPKEDYMDRAYATQPSLHVIRH